MKTESDDEFALKPCPFCGGKAKMIASRPGIEGRICHVAKCADHFCIGGSINTWQTTPERAATVWNRRVNCGNAAAMREALREAIGETCAGCKRDCDDCMNLKSGWMKNAKAALSAPPRQCDMGTPEEQGVRCLATMRHWRKAYQGDALITAIMKWAQEPYTEEGAENE